MRLADHMTLWATTVLAILAFWHVLPELDTGLVVLGLAATGVLLAVALWVLVSVVGPRRWR